MLSTATVFEFPASVLCFRLFFFLFFGNAEISGPLVREFVMASRKCQNNQFIRLLQIDGGEVFVVVVVDKTTRRRKRKTEVLSVFFYFFERLIK